MHDAFTDYLVKCDSLLLGYRQYLSPVKGNYVGTIANYQPSLVNFDTGFRCRLVSAKESNTADEEHNAM